MEAVSQSRVDPVAEPRTVDHGAVMIGTTVPIAAGYAQGELSLVNECIQLVISNEDTIIILMESGEPVEPCIPGIWVTSLCRHGAIQISSLISEKLAAITPGGTQQFFFEPGERLNVRFFPKAEIGDEANAGRII